MIPGRVNWVCLRCYLLGYGSFVLMNSFLLKVLSANFIPSLVHVDPLFSDIAVPFLIMLGIDAISLNLQFL